MSQSQGSLHEQPLYDVPYQDPYGLPSQRPQGTPPYGTWAEPVPYDTYAPFPETPYAPSFHEPSYTEPYPSYPEPPYGPVAEHTHGFWPSTAYGQDFPYGPVPDPGPYPDLDPGLVPHVPYEVHPEAALIPDPEQDPGSGDEPGTAVPASPVPGGRAAARRAERARRSTRREPGRPDRTYRLVPRALVIACLAGGTTAFVAHDKEVRLNVDGHPRTLHTFADDVGGLLEEEGLRAGAHDHVAPATEHPLANGDEVDVRYGRPLALTLDGQRRHMWTTARTVDEALRQLGVRPEGAYLSAPRTEPISRRGTALEVRTERSVTFVADGREHTVRTNAATVGEAVEEAGIELRGYDTTSVPPESFPRDGQTINVMRITGSRKVEEEFIPFDSVRREDPRLHEGTEVVAREGRLGVKRVTYELRTVNGVQRKPKLTGTEVIREPQTRVVKIGTKPLPDSVAGADGLDWEALAQCESGGRPDALDASGTYGGLYQFDTHTWHSLGGSGTPQDAPAEEQTYRAKKLYMDRGSSPWPVCGRKLTQ